MQSKQERREREESVPSSPFASLFLSFSLAFKRVRENRRFCYSLSPLLCLSLSSFPPIAHSCRCWHNESEREGKKERKDREGEKKDAGRQHERSEREREMRVIVNSAAAAGEGEVPSSSRAHSASDRQTQEPLNGDSLPTFASFGLPCSLVRTPLPSFLPSLRLLASLLPSCISHSLAHPSVAGTYTHTSLRGRKTA